MLKVQNHTTSHSHYLGILTIWLSKLTCQSRLLRNFHNMQLCRNICWLKMKWEIFLDRKLFQ